MLLVNLCLSFILFNSTIRVVLRVQSQKALVLNDSEIIKIKNNISKFHYYFVPFVTLIELIGLIIICYNAYKDADIKFSLLLLITTLISFYQSYISHLQFKILRTC